jgi:hypothetical protein
MTVEGALCVERRRRQDYCFDEFVMMCKRIMRVCRGIDEYCWIKNDLCAFLGYFTEIA